MDCCLVLTFRLSDDDVDERTAATAAAALDEVFGVGDDVDDGGDDGEPVRCLRRANALFKPSVMILPCNLCTFTINWLSYASRFFFLLLRIDFIDVCCLVAFLFALIFLISLSFWALSYFRLAFYRVDTTTNLQRNGRKNNNNVIILKWDFFSAMSANNDNYITGIKCVINCVILTLCGRKIYCTSRELISDFCAEMRN